ncbi:hypothetical protein Tco_1094848 [Tanacetum coccineum]|uniref:Uncharacterized protein n=1 Tax=Tanacetum coccineum TaxID=301880 RepID=A0ABQ5IHT2_9ASTR
MKIECERREVHQAKKDLTRSSSSESWVGSRDFEGVMTSYRGCRDDWTKIEGRRSGKKCCFVGSMREVEKRDKDEWTEKERIRRLVVEISRRDESQKTACRRREKIMFRVDEDERVMRKRDWKDGEEVLDEWRWTDGAVDREVEAETREGGRKDVVMEKCTDERREEDRVKKDEDDEIERTLLEDGSSAQMNDRYVIHRQEGRDEEKNEVARRRKRFVDVICEVVDDSGDDRDDIN